MIAKPTVALVVPAYNAGRFIAETLNSVLAQTVRPDEILVADDGSTDDTAKIVAEQFPEVQLIRLPHGGVSMARNAAIARATSEWLCFLDADDLWLPRKLELQLEAIARQPGLDIVFTQFTQFPSGGTAVSPGQGISISTLMTRAETLRHVGPFRDGLPVSEYLEWMMRARDLKIREYIVPESLVMRRIHGDNVGIRDRELRVNYVRTLKEALDRRRGQAGSAP